ncbi:bifunctional phosphopantothenoylcysteine decarboxylase/phosphopantothenate synthase [Neolewinella lacunae]|uniref:Coenzyme A biosynthesis bifunctional protein CoaBC n=1 Tax=Neolewinella lacunae TaxID=1517758 RepID=A0A923PME4_9BACT|nr:bifunctional phosphopantothenoylcysteine decarboxylase/phosphopantothenate synthase [Neolewinella lacunae]MBC6996737.1 bifunctional phosphopantothenoylcysteine decarboxylase/phosphopantothenate synthase [Neolewinella lacunae]MDN3633398.1 bifunctional phosphopantothenoylcysteine decarboxylase/phosphopantothenate synthase [Neolewinella lacunae]
MQLAGKKIILGVCGSIAAYKSALIVRGLVKAGAQVKVLMTESATAFISPLTLSTLSRRPVTTSVHDGESWDNHVELGLWADALLVAPLTATTLAKMAHGICDNPVVAVYLSARCPVFFAPAMDLDMWAHPATRRNVARLRSYGNHLIDVAEGELASGLHGAGRLAEPETILAELERFFARAPADDKMALPQVPGKVEEQGEDPTSVVRPLAVAPTRNDYAGRRLLITAGPTHEDLDPVRYLGNKSTGRMGIALAEAAAARGASVDLVLGPTELSTTDPGINLVPVRSAREMHAVCVALWPKADAAILSAAVADYRPASMAQQKIKKEDKPLRIDLVRNPDIAAELGEDKKPHQRLVGFALETENALENARGKLERKNLDLIVLNSPNDEGAAFGHTTNKIQLLDRDTVTAFELKPKRAVADDILDALAGRF